MNRTPMNGSPAEKRYTSSQYNDGALEPSVVRIRSVARVFKMVGWLGVAVFTPIAILMIGNIYLFYIGYPGISLPEIAGVTAFSGACLALAISYVITGRRISNHDLTARPRAVVLSCVLIIGFPIFTIIGIICYRHIKRHFNESTFVEAASCKS